MNALRRNSIATNIFANFCVGIALFPLLHLSYALHLTDPTKFFLIGNLSQGVYGILQLARISFAVLIGFYVQKQLRKNSDAKSGHTFTKRNLWGLIFLFIIWGIYAFNWELRAYLTDFPLKVGLDNRLLYEDLSLFRKWIYESFISQWQWLAYLVTSASTHLPCKAATR